MNFSELKSRWPASNIHVISYLNQLSIYTIIFMFDDLEETLT